MGYNRNSIFSPNYSKKLLHDFRGTLISLIKTRVICLYILQRCATLNVYLFYKHCCNTMNDIKARHTNSRLGVVL